MHRVICLIYIFALIMILKNQISKACLSLVLLFSFALPSFAVTDGEFQLWEDDFLTTELNDQWSMTNRVGFRFYNLDQNYYRVEYRPHVEHVWHDKYKLRAGVGFFYYETASKQSTMEYRPWLGVAFANALPSPWILSHSVRWEQRWFSNDADFDSRLRYQLKVGAQVYQKGDKYLQLALAPEFFYSLGSFDEFTYTTTRLGLSTSYKHSKQLSFELLPMAILSHDGVISEYKSYFWVVQLKVKYKMLKQLFN